MAHYPSIEVALDALQRRNEALERLVAERTAELGRVHREAEVEAALEQVRTQAMRVRHSDETTGIAVAVFEALRGLGLPVLQIGLSGHLDPERREAAVWVAGVDGAGALRASHYTAALSGHPVLEAAFEAGHTCTPFVERMDGGAFEAYLRASAGKYPPSYADRVVARAPRAPAYYYAHIPVEGRQRGHLFAVLSEAPSEEAVWILHRFSALFNLTHARYLDLQQAEAQSRQSQIEAALERVRARALAMRRSDELGEVVRVVFQEFDHLGVTALRSGVGVVEGPTRQIAFWVSAGGGTEDPVAGTALLEGHPLYHAIYYAWQGQKPLSYILEGDDLQKYYRMLERTGSPLLARGVVSAPAPGAREYVHVVPYPAGVLYAFAESPFSEETVQVMRRLARAFDVGYTRHLYLEQAEAQAREDALQASVDRVRAGIASMRAVADLDRITPLIWQELTALGVPFFRCAVLIVDEDERAVRVYLATPEGAPLASLRLPFESHPLLEQIVVHWRRQAVLTDRWEAAQLGAWIQLLEANGLDAATARLFDVAEPLALHFAPFAQGMLFVGGTTPLDAEDGDAVQALADAFEVAYARYDDFQRLEGKNREVEAALAELKATQQQLIQSEKLAGLGALTAGIAHEIKNPLNFVNNFAALSKELAADLAEALDAGAPRDELKEILADLTTNAEKIEAHGRRADSIVRGMMQHARGDKGHREAVDLNALVEEHIALAYHGRRAQAPDFDVAIERDYGEDIGPLTVAPQDIGRVLINLVNNAFDAVQSQRAAVAGPYAPAVRVVTRRTEEGAEVRVEDNGTGMPEAVRARVFEPFYTTKPAGSGTGLGLSMSHDIVVRGHGGSLRAESEDGHGATFVVTLPR